MSFYLEQPALFDLPIRLGPEERKNAAGIIESFFKDYRLHECRHQLWEIVECCLITDNMFFGEAEERADLLQFYKDLERLLEAAWLVVQQRKTSSQ